MRQDDPTKNIMDLLRQLTFDRQREHLGQNPTPKIANSTWQELMEEARANGLDTMEIPDLVRMADLAKDVLKEKPF